MVFFNWSSPTERARRLFLAAVFAGSTVSTALPHSASAKAKLEELTTESALTVEAIITETSLSDPDQDQNLYYLYKQAEEVDDSIEFITKVGVETNGVDPLYGTVGPLGTDPANIVQGTGIGVDASDNPLVVGYSDTDAGVRHAIMWTLAGGTVDLGTLPLGGVPSSGNTSEAFGVSGNAQVIVGYSGTGTSANAYHDDPFRYTVANSTMYDLGRLDSANPVAAPFASAYATDTDGSVIVGASTFTGGPCCSTHAFRWVLTPGTTTGVMTDIDGNAGSQSFALAVNTDGSVVVGAESPDQQAINLAQTQAFRWTQSAGMAALGTLPGQASSVATAVDGDGNIVVGYSAAEGINTSLGLAVPTDAVAFRWTAATGIQNFNTELANAGVDMTGTTLMSAGAITADGQFIAGQGNFGGTTGGYLARYCDATNMSACTGAATTSNGGSTSVGSNTTGSGTAGSTTGGSTTSGGSTSAGGGTTGSGSGSSTTAGSTAGGPTTAGTGTTTVTAIAGVTSAASVRRSIVQVAAARRNILFQEFGEAGQLLSAGERIGSGSELGVFAGAGTGDSIDGGASGRIAYGNGFSILAGLASGEERYGNVNTDTTFMGAAALRYIYDTGRVLSPYAEAGAWGVPGSGFSFYRSYANAGGVSVGRQNVNASKYYLYGRVGGVFAPTPADEFAVSIELGHGALHTGSFAERFSASDPFQASGAGATDDFTAGKIQVQGTHEFTKAFDATLWVAGADAFDYGSGYAAEIPGFGRVAPGAMVHPVWAEYGGRLGYKITTASALDVDADGVSGGFGIGTDVRFEASYRFMF